MKKISKIFLSFFIIIISMLGLTGCASIDKNGSSRAGLSGNPTCSYSSLTNQTRVTFTIRVTNGTIYNMEEESFKFSLYQNNEIVDTKSYTHSLLIKANKTTYDYCYFDYNGKIDSIEFLSWNCQYSSFWNTYSSWIITTIIIISILSIIYIVAMIVGDFPADEIIEFIDDYLGISISVSVTLAIILFIITLINWVPTVIILGGIISFFIITFTGHGIKYIIKEHMSSSSTKSTIKNNYTPYIASEENVEQIEIEDCINNEEMLSKFNKSDLITFCQKYCIAGYSGLTKQELIHHIVTSLACDEDNVAESNENDNEMYKDNQTEKVEKRSNITFDDIAGLEEAKKTFKERVLMPLEHPDIYKRFGKKVGGDILLYGLPGTGKTMFAEATSNALNALFIPIKCSDIKSKWYGESEQNVKKIFEKARSSKKAIIFFDEFEAIGAKRTDDDRWNGNNDLVPEILAEMQGVFSSSSDSMVMVIAASNKPWLIDSAFLRPGRFDEKIYIPLPDYDARKKLFELKLSKLPIENIDYDYLSNITDGYNGADITEFVEKLKQLAINESIQKGIDHSINMDDVKQIEKTIHSSVSKDDIKRLEDFQNQF